MKKGNVVFFYVLILMILSFGGGYLFSGHVKESSNHKQKIVNHKEYIYRDSLSYKEYQPMYNFWLSQLDYDLAGSVYIPEKGLLPTVDNAVQLAEMILKNVYGESVIEGQKPFFVDLNDDIWIIEGSWKPDDKSFGGTAHIEINRKNGQILRLYHSK